MQRVFDYIIVGAGSAGCVLANRLTADGSKQVLLLEAGPKDRNPAIRMPMGFAVLMHDKKHSWCYNTEAQPHMNNRRLLWPKGKVLGGSSAINGMVYIRGHRDDYNHWQANGCNGWGWNEVLPYFLKAEHHVRGDGTQLGYHGPLWIDDVINRFPLAEKLRQAGIEAGLADNPDFNGEQQDGIGYYQVNIKNGQRASAAECYLKPVMQRHNLHVITGALAQRIITDGNKAVAIDVSVNGKPQRFDCQGEIILSAGTIESPKLLELSGIGNATLLEKLGIPLVRHLPGVGENLQDHLTINVIHQVTGINTFLEETTPLNMLRNLFRYFVQHKGLLTHPAAEIGAFMRSHASLEKPDIQLHFAPAAGEFTDKGTMKTVPGITTTVCQLNPGSRGSVHIKNRDAATAPAIEANYLADDNDAKTLISAVRKVRDIYRSDVLAPYIASESGPGQQAQSDEAILAYIRQHAESLYHIVGTCKMGTDDMAVVDPQLRVRGMQNLRVVDASVMPFITAGNTHAPTVMIAEKAADMLLNHH